MYCLEQSEKTERKSLRPQTTKMMALTQWLSLFMASKSIVKADKTIMGKTKAFSKSCSHK